MGQGHYGKEDYPATIAADREALDLFRSFSTESEDVAARLHDLAIAEKASGDEAAAELYDREALRLQLAHQGHSRVGLSGDGPPLTRWINLPDNPPDGRT